jgi:hypothetical protein
VITIPSVSLIEKFTALVVRVVSTETKADAQTQLVGIAKAQRQLKADVELLKRPHKDAIAEIDKAAKPYAELLEGKRQAFDAAILDYNRKVEAEVAKQNAKVIEKYEKKTATAEAKAIANGQPMPLVLPPTLASAPPKTEAVEGGTVTTVKRKAWRLEKTKLCGAITGDEAATYGIPLDYFVLDTAKIGKAIRAGVKIPGIEVYVEESLMVKGAE